ncbi:MAG: hypothetical protein F6K26_45505 [Moorea sp. SIO2I5]|nr:hypothetical protein [Moorena sp. SIO2I5]
MNGGNPPGYLLGKINDALCSAFTSETQLAMMVRYEFSINLAQVASGGNLKEIVHTLLESFESSNSLEKLLDGALKQNPNNPKLKAIKEKFHITTSLFDILLPLEKKLINQMQQAYQACCYDDYFNDFEEEYEIADSLYKILEKLDEKPQGTHNEKPIVQFVDHLLKTGDIPKQTAKKLKQWLEKNANNSSDLLSQSSSHYQNYQQPNLDAQPYLLIKLDPSKQYHQEHQKKYLVSAWVIYENGNDNYSKNKPFKTLENRLDYDKNYKPDVISIKEELPTLIEFFMMQLAPYNSRKPIIVFLVNRQLLKYKFDIIKIQDKYDQKIVIGSEYCVVLRSIKRF